MSETQPPAGGPEAPPPGEEPPTTPPPAAAEEPRLLRRSRSDRVVAGVCGGLGRYLGIDPVLLRIATVLLVFAGGAGVLLYLVGWIVIPEEPVGAEPAAPPPPRTGSRVVVGLAFVALGAFFLLDEVLPDVFDWRYIGPALLIAIGAVILARRR